MITLRMFARTVLRAEVALRVVALVVWALVGSPRWLAFTPVPGDIAWLVGYVAFAVLLWRATSPDTRDDRRVQLFVCEAVVAIALAISGMPHFEGALPAVVAAQAAWFSSSRVAVALGTAQAIPLFVIVLPTHALFGAAKATGEYVAFGLFAMLVGYLRRQEMTARRELARERAVLLATQSLLEDATRVNERMRIAREVHDAIGHGLTAASINLELAARTHDATRIESARDAVSSTLVELRGLVGAMRTDATVDLRAALRALCAGIREPTIVLDVADELDIADEARAHVLFRCVQEAVTNAMKHARARRVEVAIARDDAVIRVTVRDDGVGAATTTTFGNGLSGLRERLTEVGGGLEVSARPGAGFEVRGWVPCEGA